VQSRSQLGRVLGCGNNLLSILGLFTQLAQIINLPLHIEWGYQKALSSIRISVGSALTIWRSPGLI
jgi:hypothetical protein